MDSYRGAHSRPTRTALLALGLITAFALPAYADHDGGDGGGGGGGSKPIIVGTCTGSSSTTIQGGVNAAPPGGTVLVCPGVYPEQVKITKPLTVAGIQVGNADAAIIVPPTGGSALNATSLSTPSYQIAAGIWVHDARNVTLTNLTVDGTGNNIGNLSSCAPDLDGILYQNSSGTIDSVAVRHEKLVAPPPALPTSLSGCQSGEAIFVESGNEPHVSAGSQVIVQNSSIHDFQKNGVTGNEVGTQLGVQNNSIIGQGPTMGAAENGIQFGYGATGWAADNIVTDNVWQPDNSLQPFNAAAGIITYGSANVTIVENQIANTQFGIAVADDYTDPLSNPGDNATIVGNTVSATHIFDAIDVCSNNNRVSGNQIFSAQESAIHLDKTCGGTGSQKSGNNNDVKDNFINETCVGVLTDSGTNGNNAGDNQFANVVTVNTSTPSSMCTPPYSPDTTSMGAGQAIASMALSSISSASTKANGSALQPKR